MADSGLVLRGTIARVETKARKRSSYDITGGELRITIEVARPETPKAPYVYGEPDLRRRMNGMTAAQMRELAESDEFPERKDQILSVAHEQDEYEDRMAVYAGQLQSFVRVVALGVAVEGESVEVEVRPDVEAIRQMLPGLSLIEAPAD